MSKAPIFILGSHKSGTSLLRSLLDGHPELYVIPFETHFMASLGRWIKYSYRKQAPLKHENYADNLLRIIEDYGHFIGLHFYVSHLEEGNFKVLQQELESQVSILQSCIKGKIDRFSYHRPPSWVLPIDTYKFSSLINVYSQPFFELIKKGSLPDKVKYMSDSNHMWPYGHPLEVKNYKCFHLLIHPDEWSEKGGNEVENFMKYRYAGVKHR